MLVGACWLVHAGWCRRTVREGAWLMQGHSADCGRHARQQHGAARLGQPWQAAAPGPAPTRAAAASTAEPAGQHISIKGVDEGGREVMRCVPSAWYRASVQSVICIATLAAAAAAATAGCLHRCRCRHGCRCRLQGLEPGRRHAASPSLRRIRITQRRTCLPPANPAVLQAVHPYL